VTVQLLRLLVFLNLDGIRVDYLLGSSHGLSGELWELIEHGLIFHDDLESLLEFSLVMASQTKDNIVIDRIY